MRHIISVLMENEAGALSRVAGLFSARGYNIESLTVAPTDDATLSRMTLVTRGDEAIIEQITKQLNKLVNVIKVIDFREVKFVDREMFLIKVKAEANTRSEALRIVDIFRGKVVDVSPNFFTIEVTGDEGKIQAILDLLNQQGIVEVVRTGKVAIARSRKNSTKK